MKSSNETKAEDREERNGLRNRAAQVCGERGGHSGVGLLRGAGGRGRWGAVAATEGASTRGMFT